MFKWICLDVNVSVNLQNTAFLFQNESSFWLIPILFAMIFQIYIFISVFGRTYCDWHFKYPYLLWCSFFNLRILLKKSKTRDYAIIWMSGTLNHYLWQFLQFKVITVDRLVQILQPQFCSFFCNLYHFWIYDANYIVIIFNIQNRYLIN